MHRICLLGLQPSLANASTQQQNQRVCVCVCVCVCVQTHQTVKTSSQKVHCTHLHGGDLGHIDWWAQIQVQQVTQQVTLARDDMWLVHGSCWPTAHWALTSINAVIGENSGTGEGQVFSKSITKSMNWINSHVTAQLVVFIYCWFSSVAPGLIKLNRKQGLRSNCQIWLYNDQSSIRC